MSTNKNDLHYLFFQLDEDVKKIREKIDSLGKLLDIDDSRLNNLGSKLKSVLSERSDRVDELILQAKQMGFGVPGMITPPHGKGNYREDYDKFSATTLMDGKVIVYQGLTCIFDGDKWGYIVPIPHEKIKYQFPEDIKRLYAVPDNYPFKDRINDALNSIEEVCDKDSTIIIDDMVSKGNEELSYDYFQRTIQSRIKDPFAELKAAHAEGKTIQYLSELGSNKGKYIDTDNPFWSSYTKYRIKPEETKVGDVCKFWDDDESIFVISILKSINKKARYPFRSSATDVSVGSNQYSNAKVVTPEEANELLFGKEVKNG